MGRAKALGNITESFSRDRRSAFHLWLGQEEMGRVGVTGPFWDFLLPDLEWETHSLTGLCSGHSPGPI